MSRCLRDRTLFLLAEGDGTEAQRTHLASCPDCAARQRRMLTVNEIAGRALREEPLPEARPRPVPGLRAWLVPAMAVAGLAALVWTRLPAPSGPLPVASEASAEELTLASVSNALFADDDDDPVTEPDDGAYVEVALRGERPCEGQDGFLDPRCVE